MSPSRMLLRRRDYWRLAAIRQLSALPWGMTPLAYTLLTAAILHSYRVGSLLVTAGVVAEVCSGPLIGRLLGRVSTESGLRGLLLVAAAGYALLALRAAHVPEAALVALAVVPALPSTALSGAVLSAMSQTLPAELLSPAVALNNTLLEGTLTAGPLIVAGLATIAPTAAIGALAVAMVLAAALVPRAATRPAPSSEPQGSLLRRPGFACWCLAALGTAVLFSTLEVGALARAHRLHGGSTTAALLLALLSVASALAGLTYAAYGHRLRVAPLRLAAALMLVMAVAMAAVAGAHSWWVAGPAVAVLGLCTAPLMTTQSLGVQATVPESQRAVGFTLFATATSAGYALGSLAVALLPLSVAQLVGAVAPLTIALVLATRSGDAPPRRVQEPLR